MSQFELGRSRMPTLVPCPQFPAMPHGGMDETMGSRAGIYECIYTHVWPMVGIDFVQ